MTEEKKTSQSSRALYFWLFLAVILIVGCWAATMWIVSHNSFNLGAQPTAVQTYGQFGDSFGVTSSLFSGLALIGVVFALMLQRQEQKESQREHETILQLQKEVLEAQKKAADAQQSSANHQKALADAQTQLIDLQRETAQALNNSLSIERGLLATQRTQALISSKSATASAKAALFNLYEHPPQDLKERYIADMRAIITELDRLNAL